MSRLLFWLREAAIVLAIVLAMLAALFVLGWLATKNYRECRAHGFSRFYCLTSGK